MIGVVFRLGIESGVKIGFDEGGFSNADIGREVAVEGAEKPRGFKWLDRGELDDLSLGMDPAVGAARGFAIDRFVKQKGGCLL